MSRLAPSFFDRPIAHRGLHDRASGVIENSMSAVRAAVEAGFGIEIDLQPSSDLTPMVFHDYMLDRLTGRGGAVASKTTQALEQIPLSGSRDTIPKLKDVLSEVAGRVPMLIEIKDQDMRLGPNVGAFQDHVCDVLADYDGPFGVMSFNPHAIAQVKSRAPDFPIGLVTDPFRAADWPNVPEDRRNELACIPDAERLGLDFISHLQSDLDNAEVARLKAKGMPVFCWTIRSEVDSARALKVADNITFEGYLPARREA